MSARRAAAVDVLVALDPASPLPLQRQVYDALREAIVSGRMAAGARLRSTRALAAELGVGRNTVIGAFERLRAEGYVTGRSGGGTRVRDVLPERLLLSGRTARPRRPPSPSSATMQAPSPSRRGRALVAAAALFPAGESRPRAFLIGTPALDAFPVSLWQKLVAQRWRNPPSLGAGDAAGYAPLRRAVAAYLSAARAVRCSWEQVVIVNGAQHGLDLAARLLLDPGDEAWIEDPGYPGARSVLTAAAARLVPVPVDGEGMRVEDGRRAAPAARLAYVTPSHQFPLGATMSTPRRLALLAWAREAGAWVLEDDYDSEFRYAGRPLPSLQGLDAQGRVVYLGTFSKTLFPALRLGYLVVPDGLVDAFAAARTLADRHPPGVEQAVVADFIEGGHFAAHLRRMRTLYAERQAALVDAARRELAGTLEVPPDGAGMHLVGWLPPGASAVAAADAAAHAGIVTTPLSRYTLGESERGALLLGYAAIPVPAIRLGAVRLGEALRAADLTSGRNRTRLATVG